MRCAGLLAALAAWLSVPCPPPAEGQTATLWAVGDGGISGPEDDHVAASIERRGRFDRLLYLGDVYDTGTAEEFRRYYQPSFGRFKSITSPTPGNHDWPNHRTGYDRYWGGRAPRTDGGHWYAFDLGGWHFISLNSENVTQDQVRWVREHVAARPDDCTIAYWHTPRYSATPSRGDNGSVEPFWGALEGRTALVLNGHDHNYQRFPRFRGIVQIVVGTGGRGLYDVDEDDVRLVTSDDDSFGALRLVLEPDRARFEFFTSRGRRLDAGSVRCSPSGSDPIVAIARPRGRAYSRRLRSFSGRAWNASGPVRLRLVRRAPRRRIWRSTAEGVDEWRYRLEDGRRLRRGRYRLVARVEGTRDALRFRVR